MREEEQRRQGSEETLLSQLESEYGLTLKKAEKEIVSLQKEVASLEKQCEVKLNDIETAIDTPDKGQMINEMFDRLKGRA